MTTFVDTSLIVAATDERADHRRYADLLSRALRDDHVVTHEYVIVETLALLHARQGKAVASEFLTTTARAMTIIDIDPALRARIQAAYVTTDARYSFVDVASLTVMRERGITDVLTLDKDFKKQGFKTLGC